MRALVSGWGGSRPDPSDLGRNPPGRHSRTPGGRITNRGSREVDRRQYQTPTGRTSSRQTDVTSGTTVLQSYQQPFTFDDLGEITAPGYPTCLSATPCTTNGPAGATFTYKDGSLVTIPGYASNITYLGNMLSQVVHQNAVTDTYSQDPTNGMPRPSSIAFSNLNTSCQAPQAPVIAPSSPVCANSGGHTASVQSPDGSLQYAWSIAGGTITATTVTYTAGGTSPVTLSVTASNSCGATSTAGTQNVTVLSGPTALVSGGGSAPVQNAPIHVVLTGTSPWTVTWSDSFQQTVFGSFDRLVSPQSATTYTITSLTDSSGACNSGTSSGSAVFTVTLQAPGSFTTILTSNTHTVALAWAAVPGATGYRIERKDQFSGWVAVNANPVTTTSYSDTFNPGPTDPPEAHLYHVIAVGSGNSTSPASLPDYAVTASTLFAENVVTGTPIRGSHVAELRQTIDKLRNLGNLENYSPSASPPHPDGWLNYGSPAGLPILASDQTAMRAALDQAVFNLVGRHITFTGTTPAPGVGISAYHITQLRNWVK